MPRWVTHHLKHAFGDEKSKKSFSQDITKLYTDIGLPAFYVVIVLTEVSDVNMYVGGDQTSEPFIRIVVDHIAVRVDAPLKIYKPIYALPMYLEKLCLLIIWNAPACRDIRPVTCR
jgi:hypothetical protein